MRQHVDLTKSTRNFKARNERVETGAMANFYCNSAQAKFDSGHFFRPWCFVSFCVCGFVCSCVCVCACVLCLFVFLSDPPPARPTSPGPRSPRPPLPPKPPSAGPPKISFFVFPFRPKFRHVFCSLWGLIVELWSLFKATLGSFGETRHAHFERSRALTGTQLNEKTPEGAKKGENWGGKGKQKARNFGLRPALAQGMMIQVSM